MEHKEGGQEIAPDSIARVKEIANELFGWKELFDAYIQFNEGIEIGDALTKEDLVVAIWDETAKYEGEDLTFEDVLRFAVRTVAELYRVEPRE